MRRMTDSAQSADRRYRRYTFRRRATWRIAAVSLVLTLLASPLAWYVAQERAEDDIVALAIEETGRLLYHHDALDLSGPQAAAAARRITGGLFDIAEIYDRSGAKLAAASTATGREIDTQWPRHGQPDDARPSYERVRLPDWRWILRVFVPRHTTLTQTQGPVSGFFEGVRVVPDWQRPERFAAALVAALMVGCASLPCGAAIYPVVVHLSAEYERKAPREVLDDAQPLRSGGDGRLTPTGDRYSGHAIQRQRERTAPAAARMRTPPFRRLRETLNELLRGRIAALRGARFPAYLLDRLRSLHAARQRLHPACRFFSVSFANAAVVGLRFGGKKGCVDDEMAMIPPPRRRRRAASVGLTPCRWD